jgi:hypothetical protein
MGAWAASFLGDNPDWPWMACVAGLGVVENRDPHVEITPGLEVFVVFASGL